MGKLWRDVYWLYTAEILPCYNGNELYSPLYVVVLHMCIPVQITVDISESPLESAWGSRKYPGCNGQVCSGCACVCVGMREYPFFVVSALWLLMDCCLFDHQVICNYTVHPAVMVAIISGETNGFVKQSWCQYFINYEHLCINSPPKARMQWFVNKNCSRMLVKIVGLVDWSYHVNAIH